jgi:hypothetical protein
MVSPVSPVRTNVGTAVARRVECAPKFAADPAKPAAPAEEGKVSGLFSRILLAGRILLTGSRLKFEMSASKDIPEQGRAFEQFMKKWVEDHTNNPLKRFFRAVMMVFTGKDGW